MSFAHFYQWVSFASLLITAGVAVWRGGWPERVAAAAMILAWFASGLLYKSQLWLGPQTAVFVVDSALLLVLLVISLRSDRWWPMWACGFHALNLILTLALLLDAGISNRAGYIAGGGLFSSLTMAALFLGAIHRRNPSAPDAASPLT
jgi:hypothetical protein